MCTAICADMGDFYFGRNMDIEEGFGERIVLTPRSFEFNFRYMGRLHVHYAMLGTAAVIDGYPLYADAMNEKGLCMAGLNFPDNAYYYPDCLTGKYNLSPFELIPYLLCKCSNISEAEHELAHIAVTDTPFRRDIPTTPLHWLIADKTGAIAVEQTAEGMRLYKNTVGVLTNNPPFGCQLEGLKSYINLSPRYSGDEMWDVKEPFCCGLCAKGLPGDYSSPSRFVRAAYLRRFSCIPCDADCEYRTAHMFALLSAVAPPRGAVLAPNGKSHYTLYSCCMNADKGIYTLKRYGELAAVQKSFLDNSINGCGLI